MSKALLFFASLCALFLFSCADSTPDLAEVQPSLVLNYKNDDSLPESSLSIFVRTTSEAARVESILLESRNDGLCWLIENPKTLFANGEQFAYGKGIFPREGFSFSQGIYDLTYTDSAGNSVKTEFEFSYEKSLLNANLSKVQEMILDSTEFLALYDASQQLIFLGKSKWETDDDIQKSQTTAESRRKVVFSKENRVICLFPLEKIHKNKTE